MSEQIFDSLCHPQYENYVRSNLPTHSPKYRDLTACNLYMSTRKGRGKKRNIPLLLRAHKRLLSSDIIISITTKWHR